MSEAKMEQLMGRALWEAVEQIRCAEDPER